MPGCRSAKELDSRATPYALYRQGSRHAPHAWSASVQRFKERSEAADEEGGPRLSFVPQPKLLKVEILPDEVDGPPDQPTSPATLAPKLMSALTDVPVD